jgi:hypothetical protein
MIFSALYTWRLSTVRELLYSNLCTSGLTMSLQPFHVMYGIGNPLLQPISSVHSGACEIVSFSMT